MALNDIAVKFGVFAFIFIMIFFGLYALIPNNFAVVSQSGPNTSSQVPDTWNGIDIISYNFSAVKSIRVNASTEQIFFLLGGRNIEFKSEWNFLGVTDISICHRYGPGWPGPWFREALDWYNRVSQLVSWYGGTIIAKIGPNELNTDFADYGDIRFNLVCLGLGAGSAYFRLTAFFSFNQTLYDTPYEAWSSSDLGLLLGITADWEATAMNVWSLIGSLLAFQTIQVFGDSGPAAVGLNFMISGLIWAAIIIFATVFTFELIQTIKPFG